MMPGISSVFRGDVNRAIESDKMVQTIYRFLPITFPESIKKPQLIEIISPITIIKY